MKPSKAIKRLTLLAKSLHPMLTRIPNALPAVGSEAFKASASGDAKTDTQRKETQTKRDQFRLDKGTIKFWAAPYSDTSRR